MTTEQKAEQIPNEKAFNFLVKCISQYKPFTQWGLNQLPSVLRDAVAKAMQEYADQQRAAYIAGNKDSGGVKALNEIANIVLRYHEVEGNSSAANHCRNIAMEALANMQDPPNAEAGANNECEYCHGKGWFINEEDAEYPEDQKKIDCNYCSAPSSADTQGITNDSIRGLIKDVFTDAQKGGGYTKETEYFFLKRFRDTLPHSDTEKDKRIESLEKEIELLKERYFTADQIRVIQEAAYDAGFVAGCIED